MVTCDSIPAHLMGNEATAVRFKCCLSALGKGWLVSHFYMLHPDCGALQQDIDPKHKVTAVSSVSKVKVTMKVCTLIILVFTPIRFNMLSSNHALISLDFSLASSSDAGLSS